MVPIFSYYGNVNAVSCLAVNFLFIYLPLNGSYLRRSLEFGGQIMVSVYQNDKMHPLCAEFTYNQ